MATSSPGSRLPITRLAPNMATIFGLCAGLTSMRYAMDERWELSVALILVAAFIDGIDGKLARMFDASTPFGAQLDSLTDFVAFGIAPPFILYNWQMHHVPKLGWGIALFFSVCCMLRLARFNTALEHDDRPAWKARFFEGIPSPAGALLALGPLFVLFALEEDFPGLFTYVVWFTTPPVVCLYVIGVALLMASRIPTLSLKRLHIPHHLVLLLQLAIAVYLIALFAKPWLIFMLTGLGYYALMPIVYAVYLKRAKRARRKG